MSENGAMPLTRQNLVDAIDALRSRSVEPFAILAFEPPAISPRLLPDLEARGYVDGGKWTTAGLEWLYGVRVTGG